MQQLIQLNTNYYYTYITFSYLKVRNYNSPLCLILYIKYQLRINLIFFLFNNKGILIEAISLLWYNQFLPFTFNINMENKFLLLLKGRLKRVQCTIPYIYIEVFKSERLLVGKKHVHSAFKHLLAVYKSFLFPKS